MFVQNKQLLLMRVTYNLQVLWRLVD